MDLSKEELQRYSRHILMIDFGIEAQQKLKNARVLVVGAGGLGCPCLLYLNAAGVGTIGISDDDVVSLSNLQRQVLYNTEDIGKKKNLTAKRHLEFKNPETIIHTHPAISAENALSILAEYDLVIDGSDNFSTRYLVNDACVLLQKPCIYGALFKFEGQVSTFNYLDGPTYRCLYPDVASVNEVPACGVAGVLNVLPGLIGTWQATEAIKVITGIGEPLSGKLLNINLLTNDFDLISFKTNPLNKLIKALGTYMNFDSSDPFSININQFEQALADDVIQVIDVREEIEFEAFNLGGRNIPLDDLEDELDTISNKNIVVVCQTGARSLKAIEILRSHFTELKIYNLKGGIHASL